jgi:putative ABC transport system substrate-binding protein
LGYSEGETIKYEYRSAEGEFARLPNLAAELVRQSVDVIVAANPPGIKAACAATSSIPIVFPVGSDPVETGLVASMERPGGNVTGVATMSWRLSHKRLELLREVIPTAIRVGLLRHSANAGLEPQVRASNLAGQALGVEVHVLQIGGTADFEPTIRSAAERGITALATLSDPFVLGYTKEVVELCSRHRLATISPFSEFVVAGGCFPSARTSMSFIDAALGMSTKS